MHFFKKLAEKINGFRNFNAKSISRDGGLFDGLNDASLERILGDQDPGEISLLALILSPDEMGRVFEVLPIHSSTRVSIARSRHHRLPQGVLQEQAEAYGIQIKGKIQDYQAAKKQAHLRIQAALSSIDIESEAAMNQMIEKDMPELKKVLEEQGYYKTFRTLSKITDSKISEDGVA